jgi:HAD superfamily hydrolase (TIGR01490 family)
MKLALFDLDHTLIPFDSGMAWTRFLVGAQALPPQAEAQYLDYCHQYVAGTLDIHAMHRASVAPLRAFTPRQLAQWLRQFEQDVSLRIPIAAQELVRRHCDEGQICALVTATTRFIAEPFARLFGIDHVVATEAQRIDGMPSGEIEGLPCFREHKVTRVQHWLASQGLPQIAAFEASWFYSDSASDLPLLRAVSNPVAVHPDERLRAHALASRWPILEPR